LLFTPLSDLLRGARKADSFGFPAGGLADTIPKAVHDRILLLLRQARRVHNVNPKSNAAGHLVHILDYLLGGAGEMENRVEVREAK